MARKAPSMAPERSEAKVARDEEAARLRSLIDSEGQPEEETKPEDPTPSPEEPDPPAEEPEDPAETPEEPAEDPVKESPQAKAVPNKKKDDMWAAIKAMESRMQEGLKTQGSHYEQQLASYRQQIEALNAKLNPAEPVDEEVQAWNGAVMETVSPELLEIRRQNFLNKIDLDKRIASLRYQDYDRYVGDMDDPRNPLAQYLLNNESEARKVFSAKDVGEALYQKGKFVHESSEESREAWRDNERKSMYADIRKELLAEFKGVLSKGGSNGSVPKPDSMLSMVNGSGASTAGPLNESQIRAMSRRDLQDLIARGEAGEDIE